MRTFWHFRWFEHLLCNPDRLPYGSLLGGRRGSGRSIHFRRLRILIEIDGALDTGFQSVEGFLSVPLDGGLFGFPIVPLLGVDKEFLQLRPDSGPRFVGLVDTVEEIACPFVKLEGKPLEKGRFFLVVGWICSDNASILEDRDEVGEMIHIRVEAVARDGCGRTVDIKICHGYCWGWGFSRIFWVGHGIRKENPQVGMMLK